MVKPGATASVHQKTDQLKTGVRFCLLCKTSGVDANYRERCSRPNFQEPLRSFEVVFYCPTHFNQRRLRLEVLALQQASILINQSSRWRLTLLKPTHSFRVRGLYL